MTGRWIIRLPETQRAALAQCRLLPGLETAEAGETIWVRGGELKETQERKLRAIPRAEWFEIDAEGELLQEGKRLTSGPLPSLAWRPIVDASPVALPRPGFAGTPLHPAGLQLVRSSEPRTPNLLLVTKDDWSRYVETAPLVRLAAWKFAADGAGRVLVRGLPLPPLPGERFVEEDGIAFPAGWASALPLSPAVVRDVLGIPRGDIALFAPEGAWEHVAERDFVPASRAAVRLDAAGEVRP